MLIRLLLNPKNHFWKNPASLVVTLNAQLRQHRAASLYAKRAHSCYLRVCYQKYMSLFTKKQLYVVWLRDLK